MITFTKIRVIKSLAQVSASKLSTRKTLTTSLLFVFILFCQSIFAQDTLPENVPDTNLLHRDTALISPSDTIPADSIATDTLKAEKQSEAAIESVVKSKARDSIRFDVRNKKIFLYENADINYEDINLQSAYVELDFKESTVYAHGLEDSVGELYGNPVFSEKGQSYKSKTMRYNYETKKGIIYKVFTEDGEGFLHGEKIKKLESGNINIQSGSYTTCNLEEHPHFEFKYYKSKVIPGKKIVTGPAYLVIEDVPTPLFIPFGLFPNEKGQRSGIVIPTYGESADRGFFFEGGGYYWAINDYLDLKLLGDIYTRGSWAIKPGMRYRKRYKYNGGINLQYAVNKVGQKGSQDYAESKDFRIAWNHSQDPKARPNSKFSASVNIVSNQYSRFNPASTQDRLSNTFRSSIAYQTNFNQKYFLTINGSHSQNTNTKIVTITLPEVTFNTNQFYPLERKKRVGSKKWYENIRMSYTMNAQNTTSLQDSLLFKPGFLNEFSNGIKHNIPISSTVKVLKHFNLTNSITLTDRMYFESYRKRWVNDTIIQDGDTIVGYVQTDTTRKFHNIFDFNYSASLTTTLYGMVQFKKGPLRAIRHVLTPTVSFTYRPDFGKPEWGYYDYYYNENISDSVQYSLFENAVYGAPPSGRSGSLNFSLSNNLEIKVPSKKDTITGMKKIALIDNFTIRASYDLARDSLRWSKVSMSGRTRLFKGLNLTYNSSWDPYVLDSTGTKRLNRYEWEVNNRFLRLDETRWNIGLDFNLSSEDFKAKELESDEGSEQELEDIQQNPDAYIDWTIPWNLRVNYKLQFVNANKYVNYQLEKEKRLVQTIGINGDVSITDKWKILFNTNYDIEAGELSYTSINIFRDLHCWEMSLNWVPLGPWKSWSFSINVKSSILQDLKLTKKKDFRDI
ncbi:MAG: LPS-assembly protein LptD [Bacteroidales bacterium]|nr:LPS-assembly protein LptD [Bacteroidales bacterium]MCF8343836.1 LPS-assembly protein LptD [Bacteroidales bacterium]MCF8351025.1 LPS-assembly protein LptD [Bacteroidales bacterium]MCF8375841.1 LPS-assembly protein LptD [Bacteroidales bacterium]MCF8401726.1 LPS-assembly protein LptD [Bacteroidales bacterium]